MAIYISWFELAAAVGAPSSRGSFVGVVCALSATNGRAEPNCAPSGNRARRGQALGTESKAGIRVVDCVHTPLVSRMLGRRLGWGRLSVMERG